jgi:hypothetical protein
MVRKNIRFAVIRALMFSSNLGYEKEMGNWTPKELV